MDFEQKLKALTPEFKGMAESLRDAANLLSLLSTLTEDSENEPLTPETLGQSESLLRAVQMLLSQIDELRR